MKKNFTILAVMLLMGVASASAQPLKIGIKGGVNTTNYDFQTISINGADISRGSNVGTGYQLGVVARLSIPKFLQIQPELLYTSRDYNYRVQTDDGINSVRVSSKRIELPVMVGFNIAALRIFAGPRFILSSSDKSNREHIPFKVDHNRSSIAFQVGAGLDIKKFFIDVRYSTYFKTRYEQFTYDGLTQRTKIKADDQWFFSAGFFF